MVRSFQLRPVPPEAVSEIMDNARRAPSAGFSQGSAFLVIEGEAEARAFWDLTYPIARRAEWRWPGLFNAPVVIVCLSSREAYLDRYAEPDKGHTDRSESRWPVPYWDIDTGFAAMIILLSAVDLGLGALFFGLGGVGSGMRGETDFSRLRDAYLIPDTYRPIGAIAVGYAASDMPNPSLKRGRRPAETVVHRGSWGS